MTYQRYKQYRNKPWLTTDTYFKKEWNEMQLIINKLMKVSQYPKDAPDDLDHPDKLEEIESFKVWIANIYNLSGDLNTRAEDILGLTRPSGQIEDNHRVTQRTSNPLELDGDRKHWEC